MSRSERKINDNVTIYYGSDHALGHWVDIVDNRFEGHETDPTGEGFLMEYSTKFGFMTNLIGATVEDLESDNGVILQKIETFIQNLQQHS